MTTSTGMAVRQGVPLSARPGGAGTVSQVPAPSALVGRSETANQHGQLTIQIIIELMDRLRRDLDASHQYAEVISTFSERAAEAASANRASLAEEALLEMFNSGLATLSDELLEMVAAVNRGIDVLHGTAAANLAVRNIEDALTATGADGVNISREVPYVE